MSRLEEMQSQTARAKYKTNFYNDLFLLHFVIVCHFVGHFNYCQVAFLSNTKILSYCKKLHSFPWFNVLIKVNYTKH